ncbi:MAG: hypothetical protein IT365_25895 [Candidatus Hydrogenedentes bacterium]|nr:hypothetical protein [Candidatus Hydrogenedentota bacterium]
MLLLTVTMAASALLLSQIDEAKSNHYRECVTEHVDNFLERGMDHYGEVQTPMFMSIIDLETLESPREPLPLDGIIRCEERQHRRNPAGCDLWEDQPLLRTLYAMGALTGDTRYADACDSYIKTFFERSRKENGMLAWGSHIFYNAYTDRPGGDQDGKGPHEILVLLPEWERMWRVTPELLTKEVEGIWEWHVVDKETGLHNRHDDKSVGCDFAFSGGSFVQAFAFMYGKTRDPKYLQWAKTVASRHWNARNPETNLAPDAPSTGDRYDAHHCFTTVSGPHAAALLRAYEVSGDPWFKDVALAYINAYLKYGWDAEARQWRAMLALDRTPVMEQASDEYYDQWKPVGYIDIWRTVMFSYEFPMLAAQTSIYAFEVTGDAGALESARHWAENIRADMPPHIGRRWRDALVAALPEAEAKGGTYAENYGRAISFFLHLHYATGDPAGLETATALADEAIEKLYANGWFKGHPAKPYCESTDGVGLLLYALLELSEYPARMPGNF